MSEPGGRSGTCGICEEVYDEFDRKPLVLPCTHSFCKSCLQQMQIINQKLCPVCRRDWSGHSTDSLIYVRQLVPTAAGTSLKPLNKTVSHSKNVCKNHGHEFEIYCNTCKREGCKTCFKAEHKHCDWIFTKDKIGELKEIFHKSVTSTRSDLIDFFSRGSADNRENLSNVRDIIKRMDKYKKYFRSLETLIQMEQETALNRLEEFENMPDHASVAGYTMALVNVTSLLDDLIQYNKVLDNNTLLKTEEDAQERKKKGCFCFSFNFRLPKCSVGTVENEDNTWIVTNSSALSSTTRRLQTEQPRTLVVDIPSDVPTPLALQQFCEVVQKKFTEDLTLSLWRSYHNYEKCDRSIVLFPDFR